MYNLVVKNILPIISEKELEQQINKKISNIIEYERIKATQFPSNEL